MIRRLTASNHPKDARKRRAHHAATVDQGFVLLRLKYRVMPR
jgi:hypothetical protein